MNTKIMANDKNKEPKVHGSGSMFVDAAIEALMQEGKDKKNFSYLLLATDGNEMYSVGDGIDRDICSAIATNMKKDSKFENFILHAVAVRMDDDPNVKTELMKIYDRVKGK